MTEVIETTDEIANVIVKALRIKFTKLADYRRW